ncbi:MAG: CotH kinase family protein [Lachnospiraceae bacterium]|nr:CotH kinase family protein [Lachnospiraceae bacterium]
MSRRISFLIILLALALLLLFSLRIHTGTPIEKLVITEDDFSALCAERTEDKELQASIYFDEQELLYESSSGCYYYSLIDGSSSAYTPSVRIKSPDGSPRIAFVKNTDPSLPLISDDMISKNGSVRLLLYDNTRYCIRSLKCTLLPILSIQCESPFSETYGSMSMTLFDNGKDSTRRRFLSDGKIRIRGGITSIYPKVPLRMTLLYTSTGNHPRKNPASLLGMPKNSDWVLYPAYNDATKVRNVFTQNLWALSCGTDNLHGIPTGVEYRYLEVFVNGKYNGLYALGYTPDEAMVCLDQGDTSGGLFKKVIDTRDDSFVFQNDPEERVYGYRLIHETRNGRDAGEEYYEQKWSVLLSYYQYLAEHAGDSEALLNAMDLDNAMDYFLFVGLIQGDDSIYKNFYLAIYGDDRHALYCPWDLDATWGNEYCEYAHNLYIQDSHTPWYSFFMEYSYLNQLLVNKDTDVLDQMLRKYKDLRSGAWSDDAVDAMLADYERKIFSSGAYLREMKRWPDGDYMSSSPVDPDQYDLSAFRSYVRERLHETDNAYARLAALEGESIYVQRTAAYRDFDRSDIIMEINDPNVLRDPDLLALIDHINSTWKTASKTQKAIDPERIDEKTRYVVFLRDKGETFYLEDFGGKDSSVVFDDDGSMLLLRQEGDRDYFTFYGLDEDEETYAYTLYLQQDQELCACYDRSDMFYEPVIVSVIYDGYGEKMNLLKDYSPVFSDDTTEALPE